MTGQRLRDARVAAGLTQDALAKKLGTSRTTVCQYETGFRTPRLSRLRAIAKLLRVELSTLIE